MNGTHLYKFQQINLRVISTSFFSHSESVMDDLMDIRPLCLPKTCDISDWCRAFQMNTVQTQNDSAEIGYDISHWWVHSVRIQWVGRPNSDSSHLVSNFDACRSMMHWHTTISDAREATSAEEHPCTLGSVLGNSIFPDIVLVSEKQSNKCFFTCECIENKTRISWTKFAIMTFCDNFFTFFFRHGDAQEECTFIHTCTTYLLELNLRELTTAQSVEKKLGNQGETSVPDGFKRNFISLDLRSFPMSKRHRLNNRFVPWSLKK